MLSPTARVSSPVGVRNHVETKNTTAKAGPHVQVPPMGRTDWFALRKAFHGTADQEKTKKESAEDPNAIIRRAKEVRKMPMSGENPP
jgi:hypothetical protein